MIDRSPPPRLITVGRLAALLGTPIHRVVHILATRPHIRALAIAGRTRLYDRDAVAQVRHELNTIDARKGRQAVPYV